MREERATMRDQAGRASVLAAMAAAAMAIALAGIVTWVSVQIRQLQETQAALARDVRVLLATPRPPVPERQPSPAPEPARPASVAREETTAATPAWLTEEVRRLEARIASLESRDVVTLAREDMFRQMKARDGATRAAALAHLATLARAGDQEAGAIILAALEDDDPAVRKEAVRALGLQGDRKKAPYLEDLVADADPEVRKEVARALGEMPHRDSGPMLTSLLGDQDPRVVRKAIKSLIDLDYRPSKPDLGELVLSDDPDVAAGAGKALRKLGDPEMADIALERVAEGLKDPDPSERLRTVRRIRDIGTPGAADYLQPVLQDEDPVVREKTAEILARMNR